MFAKPAVIFSDVEAWAVEFLDDALTASSEDFAEGVTVSNRAPSPLPARLVTVRDDGGQRFEVTKVAALVVNMWAATEEDASDLARLVVSLLEQAPGDGPIVGHDATLGPARVPEESETPHWFATVDLIHRGS